MRTNKDHEFRDEKLEGKRSRNAYSCYFEVELAKEHFGKSREEHFEICNTQLLLKLRLFELQGMEFCEDIPNTVLIEQIKKNKALSPGQSLSGEQLFTWEHCSSSTAQGRFGVMRLVPKNQHTKNSSNEFWKAIHVDYRDRGGYHEWAIPAGAPANRTVNALPIEKNIDIQKLRKDELPFNFIKAIRANRFDQFEQVLSRAKELCTPQELQKIFTQHYKNANERTGSTLLHYASANGYPPIIKAILKYGENPKRMLSQVDNNGNTPLHIATGNNRPKIMAKFIKLGADPTKINNNHETPRIIAKERRMAACVTIINEAVAIHERKDNITGIKKHPLVVKRQQSEFVKEGMVNGHDGNNGESSVTSSQSLAEKLAAARLRIRQQNTVQATQSNSNDKYSGKLPVKIDQKVDANIKVSQLRDNLSDRIREVPKEQSDKKPLTMSEKLAAARLRIRSQQATNTQATNSAKEHSDKIRQSYSRNPTISRLAQEKQAEKASLSPSEKLAAARLRIRSQQATNSAKEHSDKIRQPHSRNPTISRLVPEKQAEKASLSLSEKLAAARLRIRSQQATNSAKEHSDKIREIHSENPTISRLRSNQLDRAKTIGVPEKQPEKLSLSPSEKLAAARLRIRSQQAPCAQVTHKIQAKSLGIDNGIRKETQTSLLQQRSFFKQQNQSQQRVQQESQQRSQQQVQQRAQQESQQRTQQAQLHIRQQSLQKAIQEAQQRVQQQLLQKAQHEAQHRSQQQAQLRAQLESQQRFRQQTLQKSIQESQKRAQQQAQQRTQQQAQQRAQQQAQQKAQYQAQQRRQQQSLQKAIQQAQQRAQQQSQQRVQQQTQQRTQQQTQQRTQQQSQQRVQQQAQQRAHQQSQQRAQQQAQQRTQQQSQQRAQQQAQQRAQQQAQQRAQQQAQQRAQQQTQQRAQQQAQQRAQQQAQQRAQQQAQQRAQQQAQQRAQQQAQQRAQQQAQQRAQQQAQQRAQQQAQQRNYRR